MSIKIGVIGAGGMAQYHIAGFRQAGAEVAAIADMYEPAAQAAAEKYGIPTVLGSVEAILAMEELDAISVIVPNKFHAPLVSRYWNLANTHSVKSLPQSMRQKCRQ
jgi:predicted dehydrogenase